MVAARGVVAKKNLVTTLDLGQPRVILDEGLKDHYKKNDLSLRMLVPDTIWSDTKATKEPF
jgi:hypothetical protein